MQNRIASVANIQLNDFLLANTGKRNFEMKTETTTAPLTISFDPGTKLMEFVWQRPVCSNEYRQCIRFIGLCVAILRVQFILVDFRKMGNPTHEEQQVTEEFLQKALKNSTVKRSARLISRTGSQQQIHDAILKSNLTLPYQVKGFLSVSEAKAWLFSEPFKAGELPQQKLLIPVHCSIRELKKYALDNLETGGTISNDPAEHNLRTSRCQTDFMEILIDQQNSLLQLRWLRKTSSREFRFGMLKTGRALLQKGLVRLLVNNQRQGAITLQDQTWLVTQMKHILDRSSVEKIGIVQSPDMMQQMASESVTSRIVQQNSNYRARHFMSEDEAKDWLCIPHQKSTLV